MILKKKAVLSFACFIVMVACIAGSGCTTSSQNSQSYGQSSPPAGTTSPLPMSTVSATAIVETTPVPTTVQTVAATGTQKNDVLTVTLNSAVKKSKIGISGTPMTGNIFLVLDVTIRNNDQSNNFDYSDASFVIIDKKNQNKRPAITSKLTNGLDAPLSAGTVIMKSAKSGQIVFGVMDSPSNNYRLNIVDSTGTLLTSLDNISAS